MLTSAVLRVVTLLISVWGACLGTFTASIFGTTSLRIHAKNYTCREYDCNM